MNLKPSIMKQTFTLLALFLFLNGAIAQSVLLNIDGEAPGPFDDKSGNHTVATVGAPLNTDNSIHLPTGDDYLVINQFASLDLQQNWSVEFKIKVTDPMDSVFPLDWRSNSSVGHMHVGYNGVRGMYFSDRTQNGLYGSLVDDPDPLAADTWVSFKVELIGDSMRIWRDGVKTAASYFNGTFSEISTTTIGYSEDFRYDHSGFMLDDVVVTANPVSSVRKYYDLIESMGPNPASDFVRLKFTDNPDRLELISMDGRITRMLDPRSSTIDLTGLPKGVYTIKSSSEHGLAAEPLIIQ